MSLRPRLDNYVFPSGEPYLYPKGGMPSYVGDRSSRVIKNIVPNNYKSYQLFPKEFSNKPKLSYMFKAENGYFSQKEIPTRKTGQIHWVKSDFIKKVEPKRLLPNSVINMRNQVMSDGYPQNPTLVHQKQSETHKLGVVQKQIEELELLSQDPRVDPAKQVEFKNQADNLMITYFPNQVMIKQYSQMIEELKNVKDEIAAGGGGIGVGVGGISLTPPSKSLITTDIQLYLTEKESEKLGLDFKEAVDKKDLKQLTKIAEYLGFDKTDLSKMKPDDIELEVEYFITNNVETIKPDITIPFTNIPEKDKDTVEKLTLHNLAILENLYKKDSKDWKKSQKDFFIMNYILYKQPYLTEMDVFSLQREFKSDNKNWWSRSPTSLTPILDKFIAVKFPTSSKK